MRDKLGWASTSPRVLSAQAKLSGDQELLSMMELLQKAHILGPQGLSVGLGIDTAGAAYGPGGIGPLTGPVHPTGENVFEKSFIPQAESPTDMDAPAFADSARGRTFSDATLSPTSLDSETSEQDGSDAEKFTRITSEDSSAISQQLSRPPPRGRASLKRTYTDVSGLSLQHRLTEALAQPYHSSEQTHLGQKAAPTVHTTQHSNTRQSTLGPSGAPHGHRSRHEPAAQAIFTTESQAPWTITAANDLACLVFGVTRAEVRKLGIMEVIREERRKWLEEKLRNPDSGTAPRPSVTRHVSPASGAMGNGVTAKLLSKPPARAAYASRRSKTDDGSKSPKAALNHLPSKSRGVLLCGDVVPIQKRNGTFGAASLWVKEKQGGLIWVLEEIAEDVANLTVDEIGSVIRGSGDVEAIWGLERVRRGMDVQKLIPKFPKLTGTHTGALDYDAVARLRRFTARTSNSINIPITIDQLEGESTFRVSSFPHIAGIMVLNSSTLKVSSSNSVFSAALFGHSNPDGMLITDLIPGFDKILRLMTDEDKIGLVDGIVIPEHSFRRARALLALREGSADAAAIFLRPSGLPARHRDGAQIMIDVQMRVVKSDKDPIYTETVIEEGDSEGAANASQPAGSEVVYALWITYSRQLHAVNHGIGPVTPLMSRPGTPPHQPSPGQPSPIVAGDTDGEDTPQSESTPVSMLTQQLQDVKGQNLAESEPFEHPAPEVLTTGAKVIKKKSINDFVILEEMGQGAYGQVKLARYKKANAKKMVIKYVTKRRILVDTWHRDRRLGTVPLEIHVLDYLRRDGLQHPNIVEMADFFEDDTNYYIEMVPHGLPGMDLFDYIELRVTMEERECRKIFVQVASALQHLHCVAKVVHRDIKDENVILDGDGAVKLVDFGSAAYIKSGPFDVFVGTIGMTLVISFTSTYADEIGRLRSTRSPPRIAVPWQGARCLGPRHLALHHCVQGEPFLLHRRDHGP